LELLASNSLVIKPLKNRRKKDLGQILANFGFFWQIMAFWKILDFLENSGFFWIFFGFFGKFWPFGIFWTFWKFLKFFEIFGLFGKFWTFWKILDFFEAPCSLTIKPLKNGRKKGLV
jgi:hypothetical protein